MTASAPCSARCGPTRREGRSRLVVASLVWAVVGCRASPAPDSAPDSAPDAATVYEDFYVPALFGSWAGRVADAAAIGPGDHVLDIACGTGVVAREAAARVGGRGTVTGLDIDASMLAVARRRAPELRWDLGDAHALPYPDGSFDVVTCQFGLMFFDDKRTALREMLRVVRPGGRVVVAVWGPLSASPGYARLVEVVARHLGDDVAALIRTPFSLGSEAELARWLELGGMSDARVSTLTGVARFPSIRAWVATEVRGWVGLSRRVEDDEMAALLDEAEDVLRPFTTSDGEVEVDITAHVVVAVGR